MFSVRFYGAVARAEAPPVEEARNGARHLLSLSLLKIGDGLVDPKLTLAWLLTAVGAPGVAIGALAPLREAGSLLPQLALAPAVQSAAQRRWFWVAGAAVQGLAALGIAAAGLLLDGWAAGAAILGCLTLLAVARSSCSVSYKDALAGTIPKSRRGAVTGAASSVASALVLAFGAALALGAIPLTVAAVSVAIGVAGCLWLAAALVFAGLRETPYDHPTDAEASGLRGLFTPLREDPQLRVFLAARGLLVATALAPPFIMMLSASDNAGFGHLGPLVVASATASILSAYFWGRLSDRSSRRTMMAAGAAASVVLAACGAIGLATGGLGGPVGAAIAVFCAQIAYEGARAGRKLHLVDMTDSARRARYTALSNTLIGGALLIGGGFGAAADLAGPGAALILLALCCAGGAWVATRLDEVQTRSE